jgi:hypothetical protein
MLLLSAERGRMGAQIKREKAATIPASMAFQPLSLPWFSRGGIMSDALGLAKLQQRLVESWKVS